MKDPLEEMREYDKRIGVPEFNGWQEREIEAHQTKTKMSAKTLTEKANKCDKCGKPVGNNVFTVCDDCWDEPQLSKFDLRLLVGQECEVSGAFGKCISIIESVDINGYVIAYNDKYKRLSNRTNIITPILREHMTEEEKMDFYDISTIRGSAVPDNINVVEWKLERNISPFPKEYFDDGRLIRKTD